MMEPDVKANGGSVKETMLKLERMGLPLKQIAALCNVSYTTVWRWTKKESPTQGYAEIFLPWLLDKLTDSTPEKRSEVIRRLNSQMSSRGVIATHAWLYGTFEK